MGKIINVERSKDFICYVTPELVERRQVVDVTYNAGSYGMGGYGFLGLKLRAKKPRLAEWLVCTLFGADDWVTVNGQWLAAHPEQYGEQRPLHGVEYRTDPNGYTVPTGEGWDEFRPLVLNQKLMAFRCSSDSCELIVGDARLEISADDKQRPIFVGNGEPRRLDADDDLRRAWIMAKNAYLFV